MYSFESLVFMKLTGELLRVSVLAPGVVPAVTIMILVLIWLFNSFRPAIIVLLIAPLALVGMASGLLLTNTPFGFMALLGAMGLSGMMMENAIVLLDEIKQNRLGWYVKIPLHSGSCGCPITCRIGYCN